MPNLKQEPAAYLKKYELQGLGFSVHCKNLLMPGVNISSEKPFIDSLTFSTPCLGNTQLKIKISCPANESQIINASSAARPIFGWQRGKNNTIYPKSNFKDSFRIPIECLSSFPFLKLTLSVLQPSIKRAVFGRNYLDLFTPD